MKARPGYRLYAIEAPAKGDIEFAYHKDEIVGTRLLHREDGKMKKCLMVEVPEDMGKELQADFEKDKAANMEPPICVRIAVSFPQRMVKRSCATPPLSVG